MKVKDKEHKLKVHPAVPEYTHQFNETYCTVRGPDFGMYTLYFKKGTKPGWGAYFQLNSDEFFALQEAISVVCG